MVAVTPLSYTFDEETANAPPIVKGRWVMLAAKLGCVSA